MCRAKSSTHLGKVSVVSRRHTIRSPSTRKRNDYSNTSDCDERLKKGLCNIPLFRNSELFTRPGLCLFAGSAFLEFRNTPDLVNMDEARSGKGIVIIEGVVL